MRYDELQHTQLLRWYMCGMYGIKIGARPFLKRMFGKRQRTWNKKLVEIEMNTLRESYSGPYRALLTEGCSSG